MSDTEPFYARSRLREVREILATDYDRSVGSVAHDAVVSLLEEIAEAVSTKSASPDGTFFFVIECMGWLAEAVEANTEIYDPDGDLGTGHPAVHKRWSSEPEWDWPVINEPPAIPNGRAFKGVVFNRYSAMKMFGYTVGKKGRDEGWTDFERQRFLRDFMEMKLPAIVEATFGDDYGEPMSATRLRKVANIIASMANLRLRSNPRGFEMAIADWEADLAFLKATYYEGKGLKFHPWPEV